MREMFGELEHLGETPPQDLAIHGAGRYHREPRFVAGRGADALERPEGRFTGTGFVEHEGGGRCRGAPRELALRELGSLPDGTDQRGRFHAEMLSDPITVCYRIR